MNLRYANRSEKYFYTVKSYETVQANRMSRNNVRLGLPYVSYRGAEILRMLGAMEMVTRANVDVALSSSDELSEKTIVDTSNKALKDVTLKGFAKSYNYIQSVGNFYVLGEKGAQYLQVQYKGDDYYSPEDLYNLYYINRVFNGLCAKYRKEHEIQWMTNPEFEGEAPKTSAVSIVWEGYGRREKVLHCDLWILLDSVFPNQQKDEIERLKSKKFELRTKVPTQPKIYAVHKDDIDLTITEIS